MLSVLSAKRSGLGLQAGIKDDRGPCTRWLSGGVSHAERREGSADAQPFRLHRVWQCSIDVTMLFFFFLNVRSAQQLREVVFLQQSHPGPA